jgi:hypothetical protein
VSGPRDKREPQDPWILSFEIEVEKTHGEEETHKVEETDDEAKAKAS